LLPGVGDGWTWAAAVAWGDEVAWVAVHDVSRVCGRRQDSGSQTVMKEPA
jgi:hypothetical protein